MFITNKESKMKKFVHIAVILICSVLAIKAHASTSWFAESQNLVQQGNFVPRGVLSVSHGFDDSKFGIYGFSVSNPKYGEFFAGPTYRIIDWLTVGVGTGLEVARKAWRNNVFLFSSQGKHSLFANYEHSVGGYLYVGKYNYQALDWLGLGAIAMRFSGVGAKVELSIPSTPLILWLAPVFNPEVNWKPGGLIALRATFKD